MILSSSMLYQFFYIFYIFVMWDISILSKGETIGSCFCAGGGGVFSLSGLESRKRRQGNGFKLVECVT